MASHVRVAVQDENLHIHKGKNAAVGKSNALNVQKGFKVRKPLMDRPKHGKNANAGSSKVSVVKQKPATTIKNNKSVAQNFGLTEEEIKKCNERAKEGTERIHFSGTDMYNFQKGNTEHGIDCLLWEVDIVKPVGSAQRSMKRIESRASQFVTEEHHKDQMLFEWESELPWSPREQFKDDSFSLIDGEDDYFLDGEPFCPRDFKLKEENEGAVPHDLEPY